MHKIVRILIVVLFISGCASNSEPITVRIAPDLLFALPPLPPDMKNVEAAQIVFGEAGSKSVQFQSLIRISSSEVTVIMLDPLGRRGMEIHWRADGVTYDAEPWVPDEVRPRNILADIVVAHWPAHDVRAGLTGTKARFEKNAQSRVISYEDREVMRIQYGPMFVDPWKGSLTIRNWALGYTLKIQTTLLES